MDACFASGSRILEVGCGTGIDMVRLARRGHRVTAVDISPDMVKTSRLKAEVLEPARRPVVVCADLTSGPMSEELSRDAPFDGLLSNFGALNCIRDLSSLAGRLRGLVRPGAPFLACVMTRPCPWEQAYYLLRLKPGVAFRRHHREGVVALLGGHRVQTYYESAGGYARLFSPHFQVERRTALGLLVPPPYLHGFAERWPLLFRLAARTEILLAHHWPFLLAGDHILFEMTAGPVQP
jgi:SAM-dependent methyltransferase